MKTEILCFGLRERDGTGTGNELRIRKNEGKRRFGWKENCRRIKGKWGRGRRRMKREKERNELELMSFPIGDVD